MEQQELNEANSVFWDHVCGSTLADRMRDPTVADVDEKYLSLYPWLEDTVASVVSAGDRVLEIGPGYGTVGRLIRHAGGRYTAVDIAPNVIAHSRQHTGGDARLGNVLELHKLFDPWETFDVAVAIGCLHHTGDLPLGLAQLHRILRPGGTLLAMVYGDANTVDRDRQGNDAPFTEWVAAGDIPAVFSEFTLVEVRLRHSLRRHTDIYVTATK